MPQDIDASLIDPYLKVRPRLFAVAYRMVGSASDAEDILQDCFLRWQQVQRRDVRDAAAFLQRIVVRLCLDFQKSARVQRETYPGEWLPEPIVLDTPPLAQDVSYAMLRMLERLTPPERAAYLLHDIFENGYGEVAETLERSEASCRQLVARARQHVQHDRTRTASNSAAEEAITLAFFKAAKTGDTKTLSELLTREARLYSDGGGKAAAAINPISGPDRICRLFEGLARKSNHTLPDTWKLCRLNGLPAVLSQEPDGILQATLLVFKDGVVHRLYVVRNPDKTAHLSDLMQ